MDKEIDLDELSLLESYFCKPGEFTLSKLKKDTGGGTDYLIKLLVGENDSSIETQVHLIYKEGTHYITSNPQHIAFNVLKGNIARKSLETLKDITLKQKETLLENDEFTLFEFITWTSNEVQNFIATNCIGSSSENPTIQNSDSDYGALMKLDHIRSTNRYYKFFKDASKQMNVHLKLLRCGKLLYIVVFGKETNVKEYIKLHKTSLVDIDSNGKPCKERLLQVKAEKVISEDMVEHLGLKECGFHLSEFEDYMNFEKELEFFFFSKENL